MSHPHTGSVGSVPLHDDKEVVLSKTSREPSYASSSTLSPSRSHTVTNEEKSHSSKRSVGQKLDHAILNLAPSFFSLNMVSSVLLSLYYALTFQGTGITSILLYNLPYNAGWLQRLGITIFVLNIIIFALLSIGNIIRYIRFKGLFKASINHLMSGMFWGTLPMGLITIVVS
jgi:hypothetical protein